MNSLETNYASKMDMFSTSSADIYYMLDQLSFLVDELCEKSRFEEAAYLRWAIKELKNEFPEDVI